MATQNQKFGPHVGIISSAATEESLWARNRGVFALLAVFPGILAIVVVLALLAGADSTLLQALWRWTPFIAQGFIYNIGMSLIAIVAGTAGGILLGMGQVAPSAYVVTPSRIVTQVFRNAPWLVLLFYCIFLVPFQVTIGGQTFQIPNWLRASIGFTIPVVANFSEVVRGAVQSIPSGQWESARSLGYKWMRTMFSIILPQSIKQMIPPWMNLYAVLLMATPLASIVGVEEAMTNTRTALQAEANSSLLLPMYAYLLTWFFFYCYPIARFSLYLESRFTVR
jgi:polar amino acid transport system permease protein